MQILKKTHEKKLEIKNPISFSIDDIINSLKPGFIFVINDLFLYTINESFTNLIFHLMINDKCVAFNSIDLIRNNTEYEYTKEIYKDILKNNIDENLIELKNLQKLITM